MAAFLSRTMARRQQVAMARPKKTAILVALVLALTNPMLLGRTWVVDRSHDRARDNGLGSDSQPFKTINRAAQVAQPGDIVLVHSGEYRERVAPARGGTAELPIVYRAADDAKVVIKGSEIWRPLWQRVHETKPIYRGALDAAIFSEQRIHPFRTPLKAAPQGQKLTLGQVFVDGSPLRQVGDESTLRTTPSTWRVDSGGTYIVVHFPDGGGPPAARRVEVTVRDRIFAPRRRGLGYIHVKGFIMEHCANQFPERFWQSDSPQAGALGCRSGHHWLIEGNTIRFANSIGIDCGYEGRHDLEGRQPTPRNTGRHVIRQNLVADNGCCGIAGMRSLYTRIVGNVIERNNRYRYTAPEIGGIKVHYFIGGRIEDNLIRDNDAHGIWIDNVYRQARVTRNVVVGNHGNGVFLELGEGPILIDHNVIANTQPGFLERDPRGDGFYSHDASGLTFAHNLVFGSHRFGSFHLKATSRPRAGASRIRLLNNIFVNNTEGNVNLPRPGPDAQGNRSDHNLFGSASEYLVNPWGGLSAKALIDSVERAVGRRTVRWVDAAPRLTYREWQEVTGWDQQSRQAADLKVSLSDDLVLSVKSDNAIAEVNAVGVAGIDADFFGNPISPHAARVGPFQDIAEDDNVWALWDQFN